jgi:hypothetical protein
MSTKGDRGEKRGKNLEPRAHNPYRRVVPLYLSPHCNYERTYREGESLETKRERERVDRKRGEIKRAREICRVEKETLNKREKG